jgi:hypothetical protein
MENAQRKSSGLTMKLQSLGDSVLNLLPRDVQNASSLLNSEIFVNNFTWEKDGEEVDLRLI